MTADKAIFRRFAHFVVRRRLLVTGFWLLTAAFLVPESRKAAGRFEAGVRISGSPAASVEADLAERFRSLYVHRVLLVAAGIPSPEEPEGREALEQIVRTIGAAPGVSGTLSFLDSADPVFRGKGGGTFVIVGLAPGEGDPEPLMLSLRDVSAALERRLRNRHRSLQLAWTGEIPLNLDLRQVSSRDADAAERRAVPAALILLLVGFGSVVAALLPVGSGVLAILLTMGACALLARVWHLSILVQNIASMIGLGLGIDYALLMVSRFRESLAADRSSLDAAEVALRRAGHTLILSAFPVAIGFAVLSGLPTTEFRSIGAAGMLVVACTLLVSVTLLPACLAMLGPRINAGRIRRSAKSEARARAGSRRWRSWGNRVVSHPKMALLLAGGPLLILAGQASRLETGTLRGDWLPSGVESVRALHRLEEMGHANVIQTLRILLDLPPGAPIASADGWSATRRLSNLLEADPMIERVHSLASLVGPGATVRRLALISESDRRNLVSSDGRSVLFEILPAMRGEDPLLVRGDAEELARQFQEADAEDLTGLAGTRLRVGGLPARNAEFEDVIAGRFRSVLLLVMGATFIALFVGFRSVLLSLKAVALNLLTVGASFGALVLVFQDGHGASLFGLAEPTGRIFTIVPVLIFCIVFGLSMDYEVFLVSRVAEARREGLSEHDAIAEGLARTGGIITSAAAIMVAVFTSFAMGAFLPVQMLGFALSVAVFLDATVVRMIVGPALLSLAGRWNWWPGGLPAEAKKS